MAEALTYEIDGVTVDQYNAVNSELGIDPASGGGDWPPELRSHTATFTEGGRFVLFEVWDSREAQEAFAVAKLGPALAKVGVAPPERMEWLTVFAGYPG